MIFSVFVDGIRDGKWKERRDDKQQTVTRTWPAD